MNFVGNVISYIFYPAFYSIMLSNWDDLIDVSYESFIPQWVSYIDRIKQRNC